MKNVSSQPRLQLPKIPKSWCPSGNTRSEVFQAYQDQFLSNATVVIPGLENLDLVTIGKLQNDVNNLMQNYAALNKQVRIGTVALASNIEVDIIFSPNMPSADYTLSLTIVSPDGAVANTTHFEVTLVNQSKTVTGCKILCHNTPSGYTAEWKVQQN